MAKGTAARESDWDLGVRFSPGEADPQRLYRLDVELATRLGCSSGWWLNTASPSSNGANNGWCLPQDCATG